MDAPELDQITFLNRLKVLIPPNDSLVPVLADLLETSPDSIYRRMRAETALTFEEIKLICNHFKISFDAYTQANTDNVTFQYTPMENGEMSFKEYLISIREDLKKLKSSNNPKITYSCEDIPIFHLLYTYPLGSFKMVYWMRTILNVESFMQTKFNLGVVTDDLKHISKEIYDLYSSIPSTEIWTDRTIYGTLRQIEYFWESGMFETKKDAIRVLKSLRKTIRNIESQASEGSKSASSENNFKLYYSDIALTNNCALVDMGNIRAAYLGHFSFTTIRTTNAVYCEQTDDWLNNIIRKSTLISAVGEKTRYQFFSRMYNNIEEVVRKIDPDFNEFDK